MSNVADQHCAILFGRLREWWLDSDVLDELDSFDFDFFDERFDDIHQLEHSFMFDPNFDYSYHF